MSKPHRVFCVVIAFTSFCALASAQESKNAPDLSFRELLEQADKLLRASKYTDAAALWQRVVDANPTQADYWLKLARSYYGLKEYQKAILTYTKAVELRAEYPANSMYAIACCHAMLGDQAAGLD